MEFQSHSPVIVLIIITLNPQRSIHPKEIQFGIKNMDEREPLNASTN